MFLFAEAFRWFPKPPLGFNWWNTSSLTIFMSTSIKQKATLNTLGSSVWHPGTDRRAHLHLLHTILHHGSRSLPFSAHQMPFWAGTAGRQHCWTLCLSQWCFHQMWVQHTRQLWAASGHPYSASSPADQQPQPEARVKGKWYFKYSLSYSQTLKVHKAIWYSVQACKVVIKVTKSNAAGLEESQSHTVQLELLNSLLISHHLRVKFSGWQAAQGTPLVIAETMTRSTGTEGIKDATKGVEESRISWNLQIPRTRVCSVSQISSSFQTVTTTPSNSCSWDELQKQKQLVLLGCQGHRWHKKKKI